MTRQIKALASTHIVVGGLCICLGNFAVILFSPLVNRGYQQKAMADVGIAIFVMLSMMSEPGIIGGLGLLYKKVGRDGRSSSGRCRF